MRALLAIAACVAAWAQELPPSSLQLVRIREHMTDVLTHQPNYTCLETVERSTHGSASRRPVLEDMIRLEVALVDGQEMFAWPGSKKFEETDLRKMIPTGTFGNGNYALHARSVFMGRAPTFIYRGAEVINGAAGPLERYDFRVPRELSGYQIRMEERSGIAGYHGSFWAEKGSLDVRRLEVVAEDIPEDLGVRAAADHVDYARISIGTGAFLLPVQSDLDMTDLYNIESHNHVIFSNCRQYTGESTLKFDDDDAPAASPTPNLTESDMPAGVSFTLALDEPVDLSSAAVGDAVHMRLTGDLRLKAELLAHKGAAATGRITRLERNPNYVVLGITIVEVEGNSGLLKVRARLDNVVGTQFLAPPRSVRVSAPEPQPGEGLIVLGSGRLRLSRGILMYWRT